MHALAILAALVAPALAQETSYVAGLLGVLNAQNLTSLVTVAATLVNNSAGAALFSQLAQGNKTVFLPNNEAVDKVPQETRRNPALLTSILTYHVVDGHYNVSDIAIASNHTILRTFLTNPPLANLENGQGQALVGQRIPGNTPEFIILDTDETDITRTTSYQNLIIHVVNKVLTPPGSISQVAELFNLTALTSALTNVSALSTLEATKGVTIFAPRGIDIFTAVQQLGPQAQNATLISAILNNHVIKGQTVYSPAILSSPKNLVSAGGQPFSFITNSSGTFVTSGPATARIIRTDLLTNNGVMHVINGVLANPASNPAPVTPNQSESPAPTKSTTPTAAAQDGGAARAPINSGTSITATLPAAVHISVFSAFVAGMCMSYGGGLVL
ncbi:Transforming growth factor-beta-induced protein ig-h3 [Ceratobasidium theobromae]|uniref:Transforming growth factor-beta-induced protein ig-h3 n=1 Tax=Ceratobasidium theobromae TaxID=1582974 RepID=A0A5N5QE67_9AGAM|nr:Transforming growth factor-beta-induced protein ig-h3 [Ceratobasidium theobromae]